MVLEMSVSLISFIVGILCVFIYLTFIHKFSGNTTLDVIKVFKRDLYRCNLWKTPTIYIPFIMSVHRGCPGESYSYNMFTNKGRYTDLDREYGDDSWDFTIGDSSQVKGKKVILRKRISE